MNRYKHCNIIYYNLVNLSVNLFMEFIFIRKCCVVIETLAFYEFVF